MENILYTFIKGKYYHNPGLTGGVFVWRAGVWVVTLMYEDDSGSGAAVADHFSLRAGSAGLCCRLDWLGSDWGLRAAMPSLPAGGLHPVPQSSALAYRLLHCPLQVFRHDLSSQSASSRTLCTPLCFAVEFVCLTPSLNCALLCLDPLCPQSAEQGVSSISIC